MSETPVHFLVGPTASGKTAVALEVAETLCAEIVSMDSMAVYKGMDIATAKPTPEERARAPHHLLDILEPHEHSSVGEYVKRACAAVDDIRGRGKTVLFVGGTHLYLKAMTEGLFDGPEADWELRLALEDAAEREGSVALHRRLAALDPAAARRIHPNDIRRIVRALEVHEKKGRPISAMQTQFGTPHGRFRSVVVALFRRRDDLHARIARRVDAMFDQGLIDETRRLLSLEKPMGRASQQAVGYAEVIAYLHGRIALEDAKRRIKARTRQFVRKQMTWLRKFDQIEWVDVAPEADPRDVAADVLEAFRRAETQIDAE